MDGAFDQVAAALLRDADKPMNRKYREAMIEAAAAMRVIGSNQQDGKAA